MKHTSITSLNNEIARPEATPDDLLNDTSMMLGCVVEQLRAAACELGQEDSPGIASNLFGTLYLAEITKELLSEGHRRVLKASNERSK